MAEGYYHVPSVPRGLLLPVLDTYEVREEELPDPTPPGSHWLFRPPPFISWVDLEAETVTIENPSAWRGAWLDGYTLTDRHHRHTYHFPSGSVVRARRSLILYCCPGKLSDEALENLPRNALLWRNQDGSLRKKEVLDNTGDFAILSDAGGKEIAALEILASKDGKQHKKKQMKRLAGVKRAQVLALRTLVLSLYYLRLVFTGVAAARVTVNPDVFLLFTGLAHLVDLLSRWASSQPGVPMDSFGVVLATMGDRLSALVLLGSLVLLDNDPRHSQIFAGMLSLDMATSWLLLSVASSSGGSDPLAGGALVRGRDAAPDFPTLVMLRHPFALTLVSLGNEAFLLWSYFEAASSLPLGLGPMVAKAGSLVSDWFFADGVLLSLLFSVAPDAPGGGYSSPGSQSLLMSAGEATMGVDGPAATAAAAAAAEMDLDGGVFGGFEPSRINPAALGLAEGLSAASDGGALEGTAEGGAVAWKAVWMVLAVCCACRQLLSCIQAVISLSSLSSGVISNAAGKDLRRRNPRPRRGRGSSAEEFGGGSADGTANHGGGGSGSVSRARSRSRLR
eukprot:g6555.t1